MSEAKHDATEESTTESVCSCCSRQSISDVHVVTDGVLQQMGVHHRKLEELVGLNDGEFRAPAKAVGSSSVEKSASSGVGTPVEPKRAVSFSEPPKDSEVTSMSSAASTRGEGSKSRRRALGVYVSHLHVSRRPSSTRKAVKKVRRKRKKKRETLEASPSSSNQRLRTALGPSLGSFGFFVLFVVGMALVLAYAIAFRGGRVIRRQEGIAEESVNGTVASG
ncbi:uncharacterized protein [Dermacentor andersoni]|uniref:uncharacterized protein n=1 Tax=Dermacentor andersoni TaxID=34620 RepID=UPI002417F5D1|nr:uncharacterized protein LOC129380272 [Dermacentor andersoni]